MTLGDSEDFAGEVASRILGLLSADDRRDLRALASRLNVPEDALRLSLDPESPRPALRVVVAIVRVFGVDPTWLLTGDYDSATHRRSFELDERTTIQEIRLFASRRTTPTGVPIAALLRDDRTVRG